DPLNKPIIDLDRVRRRPPTSLCENDSPEDWDDHPYCSNICFCCLWLCCYPCYYALFFVFWPLYALVAVAYMLCERAVRELWHRYFPKHGTILATDEVLATSTRIIFDGTININTGDRLVTVKCGPDAEADDFFSLAASAYFETIVLSDLNMDLFGYWRRQVGSRRVQCHHLDVAIGSAAGVCLFPDLLSMVAAREYKFRVAFYGHCANVASITRGHFMESREDADVFISC
ncbi:hypothetical protein AAVH_32637, partial [Aphelenchoides avenae]